MSEYTNDDLVHIMATDLEDAINKIKAEYGCTMNEIEEAVTEGVKQWKRRKQ